MSDYQRGDRVLVECYAEGYDGTIAGNFWCNVRNHQGGSDRIAPSRELIHPHPSVPVADLLEELELRDELEIGSPYIHTSGGPDCDCPNCRLHALRAAREQVTKPKYQEGQEVWVRGQVVDIGRKDGRYRVGLYSQYADFANVHPDDIRTKEP